jgi:thioredoxin 1
MLVFTDQNFENEVLKSKKPVLTDFWAPWCAPCLMITPILEEIANEFKEKIKISKVNVDENPQVASEYKINAIPALFIFKDGKVIEKMLGLQPKENLVNKLNPLI